jgi:hypothetical protein
MLFLTACNKQTEKPKPERETFYSLVDYEAIYGKERKSIGDEYIKLLKDESLLQKKYNYVFENVKKIAINRDVDNIENLVKNESFYDENREIFEPFNSSSLSRVIYHKEKALVSFGFVMVPEEGSFVFGDFLLELKGEELLIYTLEVSTADGPPIKLKRVKTKTP